MNANLKSYTDRIAAIKAEIQDTTKRYASKPAVRAVMLRSLNQDLTVVTSRMNEVCR